MKNDIHAHRILIIDFGSQTTQLIARRIREAGVYCEIHPFSTPFDKLRALKPQAVVLSGGPSSVYDEKAPTLTDAVYDLGVPVLGICYGVQLTAQLLGGRVEAADTREYGRATVRIDEALSLIHISEPTRPY